jgi:hypothetical protein
MRVLMAKQGGKFYSRIGLKKAKIEINKQSGHFRYFLAVLSRSQKNRKHGWHQVTLGYLFM